MSCIPARWDGVERGKLCFCGVPPPPVRAAPAHIPPRAKVFLPHCPHAARVPRLPPVGTWGEKGETLSFRSPLRQNSDFTAIHTAIPAVFPPFAALSRMLPPSAIRRAPKFFPAPRLQFARAPPATFCRVPKFSPRAPVPAAKVLSCIRQRNRVRLFAKRSILRANFRQSADRLVTEKKKTAKRLEKKSVFVYNI